MLWLDIAGLPGAGKSTLARPVWGDKSIGWDGLVPPAHWAQFLDEITNLCVHIQDHPTFPEILRISTRYAQKMSSVYRMQDNRVFVQTGWCQCILGFGWRVVHMNLNVNLIRRSIWLMPVSVGVAFLEASQEVIKARNRARLEDPATAQVDRSFMVEPMLPAITLAKEVLQQRGIPVIGIDVEHQSTESSREELYAFSDSTARNHVSKRVWGEISTISKPPRWWQEP